MGHVTCFGSPKWNLALLKDEVTFEVSTHLAHERGVMSRTEWSSRAPARDGRIT